MNVEMYERAIENAAAVVHNIKPDQLSDPTPCMEWDVRALLNHMVGGCEAIVKGASGEPMPSFDEGDHLGDDYVGAFDRAAKSSVEVWRAPDSFDKTFSTPWGDTPGQILFGLALSDAVVHGWDLARATGQQLTADDETAEAIYTMTTSMLEPKGGYPRGDSFGDPVDVPDDAPALDRALGYLGRDPTA